MPVECIDSWSPRLFANPLLQNDFVESVAELLRQIQRFLVRTSERVN